MAIGGIGSSSYGISSNFYNYQSSINNMKLQQALDRYSSSGRVESIPSVSGDSLSSSFSFVKTYNKEMSDLLNSANALKDSNSSGVLNQLGANSSDKNVVTTEVSSKLKSEAEYDINVTQLAKSQTNTSEGVKSSGVAEGDVNLSITSASGRTYDVTVGKQKADGGIRTNQQQLKDMADAINFQKLGVSASVVQKDGKSFLELKSDKTGEANGFEVAGASAESMNLNQASVAAQDAVYSVSKDGGNAQQYTSASNKIDLSGQISATLKSEGSASVKVSPDQDKVVKAVEDLVKDYNEVLSTLSKNADRGSGVMSQLNNMLTAPASQRSLEKIGITVNKDATLSVDKEKLTASLKENPDLAKDIIGGSNGLANGAYKDATSGLSRSSSSLMNYDMEQMKTSGMNNSIDFMNLYSKTGSVNLMNYYASGLFYNMTV